MLLCVVFNSEIFIARRLSRGGNRSRNVMVTLAVVTVAVSMAVMILSVAVIKGFRSEITARLAGFGGHIQVTGRFQDNPFENSPIRRDTTLEAQLRALPLCLSVHPFATKGGMITTADGMQGVMLKGVGKDYNWDFYRSSLLAGELPRLDDSVRTKDLLISKAVADMLRLEVGSTADMLFISTNYTTRRDRFRVCGIYSTGLEEMDKAMALTDIRNVQRLAGWDADRISGYEIATRDFSRLAVFAREVQWVVASRESDVSDGNGQRVAAGDSGGGQQVVADNDSDNSGGDGQGVANSPGGGGQQLQATTIAERYQYLFDWLATHNVNAVVIITIMLIVSLINMIAALLIIILERIGEIAVLKTLGMRSRALQKVFVYHCGSIVVRGMLWGNAVGIALCLIQKYTGVVTLDQSNYFLSRVPISLGWWIVALNAGSLALLVVLLAVPATVISLIKPEKSLRFK